MAFGFDRSFLIASGLISIAFFMPLPALAQQQAPSEGANFEVRLSQMEEQMRVLNGRIEQLEFSVRRLDSTLQRQQTDIDARLARLESGAQQQAAVSQPPVVIPPQPASNIGQAAREPSVETPAATANGTLGAIKMQDGKITGAINNPQAPPLPDAGPDYALTSQEQYDRAFDLLREANYDDAGTAFQSFIAKNPQDKLIDNAKYWYGETLYVRGKFDAAAVAFADAYKQNPKGNKAPDSLLKLAMSLENIEKTQDACATLDSLKSSYPNASLNVRQRADQERAKLKCAAAH